MPRAGLSPAVVAQEAAAVADEIGWEQLTLAVVAGRLGVRQPSLYKHVDGLAAVRREVALLALDELGRAMADATTGRSGSAALHAMADAYRGYAVRHPGRYAATVRAPAHDDADHEAGAAAVLRVVLAVLGGYGLHDDVAIDATRALRAALHGFVALETGGGFGIPQDVDRSFRRMVSGFDDVLDRWPSLVD